MKELFEIGEWVGTEDGLGQVIYNRPIHVERFNKQEGKENIGTHLRTLYVCKILCDFEGNPKRVFKTDIYAAIEKLTHNELKLIDYIKDSLPETYKKYLLSENKKILQCQNFVSYALFDINEDLLQTKFINIKNKLPYEFTFKEFEKIFICEDMPFSILEYIQYGYDKPKNSTELTIRFDSDLYKVHDKELIFKNFRVFINKTPLKILI